MRLDDGETWTWVVSSVVVPTNTTFVATGYGEDQLGGVVTYPAFKSELDAVDVLVLTPSTAVSITSSEPLVHAGDTVDLTVTETNDGDEPTTWEFALVSVRACTIVS